MKTNELPVEQIVAPSSSDNIHSFQRDATTLRREAKKRDGTTTTTSTPMSANADTEDASETDLAKHNEDDYVEIKEQMYQDKLASLKRQLQQLQEGTLQEYQKRMKKLDQQYKERLRNADLFLQLETEQVERNYIKEKKAAVKEFDDKKVELKENLIAELEEKKKMIENEKLTMELTGDSMEVKPIMTRKLRRRPNDPVPIPDKRRKPAPAQLNYLLTDDQIMEDLRTLNKLKSPKQAGRQRGLTSALVLGCVGENPVGGHHFQQNSHLFFNSLKPKCATSYNSDCLSMPQDGVKALHLH
ncbi:sin3 histone deacetylase corepressor complex component SDS3 isoform X3 [Vanacampus margaritifer]